MELLRPMYCAYMYVFISHFLFSELDIMNNFFYIWGMQGRLFCLYSSVILALEHRPLLSFYLHKIKQKLFLFFSIIWNK